MEIYVILDIYELKVGVLHPFHKSCHIRSDPILIFMLSLTRLKTHNHTGES